MSKIVKIKICGLRTAEVAAAAVDAGADYVGVVFATRSPRFVTIDEARAVAKAVHGCGHAQMVGLFVQQDLGVMRQAVSQVPLDQVQLHGRVEESQVRAIAPTPVVVAMAFDPQTLEAQLKRWDAVYRKPLSNLSAVLIDTPDPSRDGGTGVAFDWEMLRRGLDRLPGEVRVPIMLAGGLTPDNVAKAIRIVQPWGVDVSSGVESQRGIKDATKVRAFCEAVRGG